ncbi:MAG: hypothetical protein ACRENO_04910 [Thermodesulfobacteriota bacterium]
MKKKLFTLSVLALAIMFSSTLFTTSAHAAKNVKRQENHGNYSSHVKPNSGHKYCNYKKDNHYNKPYKHHDYEYDRYRHDSYRSNYHKKDDSKFFFSLVLPITYLFNGYDSNYDGY